jgi:hypothetical protein
MSEDTTRVLPDGFVPVQASYGDELSTTDVTSAVMAKLRGESLNVTADKSLVPAVSFSDKVELTEEEQEEIKQQASKECKSPNDKTCMDTLVDRYSQAKLQEKSLAQTQAGGIKGERLTIIATNSSGQQRTFYVPKGFTLLGGDAAKSHNKKKKTEVVAKRAWEGIAPTVINILWMTAGAFLYVFSVLTTWRNLTEKGYEAGRWAGTAIAVLVPFSGFAIQLGLFAALRFGWEVSKDFEKK